ncbi:hypothetical protein FHU33_1975 [Blastococcus colisei]|uniref:Uncharacterized protein n=1 Tax=Blastococcus colisei TaxID=1564162 RepID=A0A543PES7_9ACTN|nr:hypothetical protein [Blastococcus colisei]TQN42571.1 hypothetical protein FHU33_1975 [Blastococcus colisei]
MKKRLIALTLGEVAVLVGALAGYLVAITRTLRDVSQTLARITMGVRAIERQTEPIGPALREVNTDLDAVASALERG